MTTVTDASPHTLSVGESYVCRVLMIPVPLKIERTDAEGGEFGLSVSLVIDGQQMLRRSRIPNLGSSGREKSMLSD